MCFFFVECAFVYFFSSVHVERTFITFATCLSSSSGSNFFVKEPVSSLLCSLQNFIIERFFDCMMLTFGCVVTNLISLVDNNLDTTHIGTRRCRTYERKHRLLDARLAERVSTWQHLHVRIFSNLQTYRTNRHPLKPSATMTPSIFPNSRECTSL